jgi:hypothetical protein
MMPTAIVDITTEMVTVRTCSDERHSRCARNNHLRQVKYRMG